MESLYSQNKNIKYLLCITDVFTEYTWVKSLKDKKAKTVPNIFFEKERDRKYWLTKEDKFTIKFCKNGQTTIF